MRGEIKKIAADLGFEFNANARGLNTSRTGTIGIILDDQIGNTNLHFFTNSFLAEIRNTLEKEDLDVLTSFTRNSYSQKDNIIKLVNGRKVDGLIILNSSPEKESINFLKESRVPFVFSHQIPKKRYGKVNAVYCDHMEGGRLAVEHLISRGPA